MFSQEKLRSMEVCMCERHAILNHILLNHKLSINEEVFDQRQY